MKKIYIIGIGGIGISGIARYYHALGYKIIGSDKTSSELIESLKKEGMEIEIGEFPEKLKKDFKKVIYTEAIPKEQSELQTAKKLGIQTLSYPEAVGEISTEKKLIAISGTHGKSTTTSLVSLILKNSDVNFTTIVGTLLKEFDGKNFFHQKKNTEEEYFVIEACEYKKSFLYYRPYILVITNVELDHIDCYKNEEEYKNVFRQLIGKVQTGGCVIIDGQEQNSQSIIGERNDIQYIEVFDNYFLYNGQKTSFPKIELQVPGKHILYDAKLGYTVGKILNIDKKIISNSLKKYTGVWRRMEQVGQTKNGNIVMSDYGHHPTEIKLTISSLKHSGKYSSILTVFQPHQYNRTIELLTDFSESFGDTDELIIPNIYESRDSEEDKKNMNTEKFVDAIIHQNKKNGENFENTLILINEFDKKNKGALILLLGAGDVDNLRYEIEMKEIEDI